MADLSRLQTPQVLVDTELLAKNMHAVHQICAENGVKIRPHIKTHKMVEVGKMQLDAGAVGFTCAKMGEAEALLETGVRSIFIAHSLVDKQLAERLRKLSGQLEELILAVTSVPHAKAFLELIKEAGIRVKVALAVDTGTGREGVRTLEEAKEAAALLRGATDQVELVALYTHEGYAYLVSSEEVEAYAEKIIGKLREVQAVLGGNLELWPGCSVTAKVSPRIQGVNCIRPGAYLFGDLFLAKEHHLLPWEDVAITVYATVVDRPEPGLALINAGSKVFSSDRTDAGEYAIAWDGRDIAVKKVSEEHGFLKGKDVDSLKIGDRLRLVPAHVCPVINLTDTVITVKGEEVGETWTVAARGCVR